MNLRIVPRPHDRTIGVALLLPVGSFLERPGQDGVAHVIEHLLFKRTRNKPPAVLRRLENDAGFVDAFTDRDHSGFLCRTVAADLPKTLDYLLDVVFSNAFTPGDLASERKVVLQEISEDADDPWAVAYDAYAREGFGRYGRPVGGCPRTVNGLSFADVRRFVRANYHPSRAELAIAGPVPPRAQIERIVRRFDRPAPATPLDHGWGDFSPLGGYWSPRRGYRMGYLCWGFPFREISLYDAVVLRAFATATGEGPSSILWHELREKRSLVYDLNVGVDRYRHAATCHFTLAARRGAVSECVKILEHTIGRWRAGKVDRDGIRVALKVMRRGELSRREDPLDWACSVAWNGLTATDPDESLRILDRLTPDDVVARIRGGLLPEPVLGRA